MHILFVGSTQNSTQSAWQRCETMKLLGPTVSVLDLTALCDRGFRPLRRRIDGRAYRRQTIDEANAALFGEVLARRPDVAWIEKGLFVQPETLAKLRAAVPGTRLVAYQDDNPFGRRGFERSLWSDFLRCIPHYDLHLVKRLADFAEFKQRGARRVELCTAGYYEPAFARIPANPPSHCDHQVTFFGTRMEGRGALIRSLLWRHRLDVHVYGIRWNRSIVYHLARRRFHPPLPLEASPGYVDVIRASRINLGLVSKSNFDEYNGRSFEIPAAGGFFLAERTPTHSRLYREGVEAEFFSDERELVEKCRYYLTHEEERKAIASAGQRRARRDDYSLTRRLRDALAIVWEPASPSRAWAGKAETSAPD